MSLVVLFCPVTRAADTQVLSANAEFEAGMSAREKGDDNATIQHLKRAVILDPKMTKAHFALGWTADHMCLPSGEPGQSEYGCGLAIQQYKQVLELDPSHADALVNLAHLEYQFGRVDESESHYRKALSLHADDPELLCAVAAIDLRRAWHEVGGTKVELNLTQERPLIDSPSCTEVRERNEARLGEGIGLLTRALQVRNKNLDLMLYLSASYHARAEIQCGNRQAYEADMEAARKWSRMERKTWHRKARNDTFEKCPPAPPPMPDKK